MEKIEINIEKLIELIKKNSVSTYLLGIESFEEKAINARTLLEEIHKAANCDKDSFINHVNENGTKDLPVIDVLLRNIKHQGMFKIKGLENLGKDPYIMYKDIIKLIPGLE